jgi:hypothetical protein
VALSPVARTAVKRHIPRGRQIQGGLANLLRRYVGLLEMQQITWFTLCSFALLKSFVTDQKRLKNAFCALL